MQQTQKSAAKTEAQSNRSFRLVNKRGVVEFKLVERVAQIRELSIVNRKKTGINHGIGILISRERLFRAVRLACNRVSDLGLPHVFHAGDNVSDFSGRQCIHRHHFRADNADFRRLVNRSQSHHRNALTRFQSAVSHANIGHDSAISVVNRVENQSSRACLGVSVRSRDINYNAVEKLFYAFAGFAGHSQNIVGRTSDKRSDFLCIFVRFRRRQVNFVQNRNNGQIVVDSHIQVRKSLRFDSLGRIDKQHSPFASSQGARNFVRKINVSGRVNHSQRIFCSVVNPRNAHSLRFNRNAALLFDIHPVEKAIVHLPLFDYLRKLQNAVCDRRFAVIDMRDNAKVAYKRLFSFSRLVL